MKKVVKAESETEKAEIVNEILEFTSYDKELKKLMENYLFTLAELKLLRRSLIKK